ncbi:MAG: hypothetical protein OEW64_03670 [Gammaproteobacteria bacterium]|nr:hypothetical protein [Gammaproteobacteria bacterium]MDH5303176.1 hypothetical protein [Gammaproteobacteria bacterium]MDH5320816.1 hypothetical protein [Gammaproteobacteria bacterium]
MTDERLQDEAVSAGYRRVANERTPAHLDQQVLRMAANHAEHADYARSISWTRPLAWAATVALCLAITLQLTRVPAPDEITGSPQSPALPSADQSESDMPAAERPFAKQFAPAVATPAEKLESAAGSTSSLHEQAELAAPAPHGLQDEVAASFELKSGHSTALRQTEEMARLQNGTNVEQRANSSACPEESRTNPESWLQCILELEETGDQEAAALERKSLVAVFPEFKLP